MAWNGSEDKSAASVPPKATRKSPPSKGRGLVALVIIALGGAFAIWFFGGQGKPATSGGEGTRRPTKIAEVKPQIATNAPAEDAAPPAKRKLPKTREEKLKYYRDKYGDNPPENLKATIYFLEHPPTQVFKQPVRFDYLKHPCERQLASMLTAEPGALFVMKPTFDSRFDRDFQNAFMDSIDVFDTDSDEVKSVKEDVEAAKKELADICRKEGRLPSEVMSEYAENMYELGKYRQSLEEEISQIHGDPSKSDADVELFIEAANKMLKSKGAGEIAAPSLMRRGARLKMLEYRRQKKESTADSNGNKDK